VQASKGCSWIAASGSSSTASGASCGKATPLALQALEVGRCPHCDMPLPDDNDDDGLPGLARGKHQ
jgi:hypothetical protein